MKRLFLSLASAVVLFWQSGAAWGVDDKGLLLAVQKRLVEEGYDVGKPDGLYGRKTWGAIREHQRKNSLTATGALDVETLRFFGIGDDGGEIPEGISTGAVADKLSSVAAIWAEIALTAATEELKFTLVPTPDYPLRVGFGSRRGTPQFLPYFDEGETNNMGLLELQSIYADKLVFTLPSQGSPGMAVPIFPTTPRYMTGGWIVVSGSVKYRGEAIKCTQGRFQTSGKKDGVTFKSGTKCKIGDQNYYFENGAWYSKEDLN